MKNFLILVILLIGIFSSAYAKERNIYCEIEDENAVTYFVHHSKKGTGVMYFNSFVKYIDNDGNENYWIRIGTPTKARFMYYMDIEFDNQKYRLREIKNPTHYQIFASNNSEKSTHTDFFTMYAVPNEVIAKLKTTSTPITLIVNKQSRQDMKINTDIKFTNAVQKLISLTYNDYDVYWQASR